MATQEATSPNCDVFLDGTEVNDGDFISYVIERDMFQPDMATIVISNKNDIYAGKYKIGSTVKVLIGDGKGGNPIFIGEVTGFKARYKGKETTTLTIEAMNQMHRLLRVRTSKAFVDKNDKEIIDELCKKAELKLEFEHKKPIKYKEVYQHNLTGLEMTRTRAARIGCYVWCVDKTLHVKEPDFSKTGPVKLSVDEGGNLRAFTPRMTSAPISKKVVVKGWDPEKKEIVLGEATQKPSGLGSKDCVPACDKLIADDTHVVDLPCWTKEEADVLAAARLRDLNMQFITGEAECAPSNEVDLGQVVEITANAQKGDDPFNGKYFVVGITHRHTMPKAPDGGQVTILRLARDGQGA